MMIRAPHLRCGGKYARSAEMLAVVRAVDQNGAGRAGWCGGDAMTEPSQLTLDPDVAPGRVLSCQALDERDCLFR
jgi:hypothetical protein